jgi:hypothetical protein
VLALGVCGGDDDDQQPAKKQEAPAAQQRGTASFASLARNGFFDDTIFHQAPGPA